MSFSCPNTLSPPFFCRKRMTPHPINLRPFFLPVLLTRTLGTLTCSMKSTVVSALCARIYPQEQQFFHFPLSFNVEKDGGVRSKLRMRTSQQSDVKRRPFISDMCVAPSHRRKGLARQLLTECERTVSVWGENMAQVLQLLHEYIALNHTRMHRNKTVRQVVNFLLAECGYVLSDVCSNQLHSFCMHMHVFD
jgi:GNAT superfamily N-acetyltransferase